MALVHCNWWDYCRAYWTCNRFIIDWYYDAPDLQDVGGNNAYRFINAVSDFATHNEPLRRTTNYKENLFMRTMDGNPMIDRAYQIVKAA